MSGGLFRARRSSLRHLIQWSIAQIIRRRRRIFQRSLAKREANLRDALVMGDALSTGTTLADCLILALIWIPESIFQ